MRSVLWLPVVGVFAAGCSTAEGTPESDGSTADAAGPDAPQPDGYPPDGSGWNCFYAPLVAGPVACDTHADCPATAPIRCPGEWVCADGYCVYGSRGPCESSDSCPAGSACTMSYDWYHDPAHYPDSFTGTCTQRPLPCSLPGDCPAFPPGGLTTGSWSCTDGLCTFPGWVPAYR